MISDRFEEIVARRPQTKDEDTENTTTTLKRAYERQKLSDQGIYDERDYWSEEDDYSASDYDAEVDKMDDDDEDYESDEDMEDLDADLLKADMETDVEVMRVSLEGYRID